MITSGTITRKDLLITIFNGNEAQFTKGMSHLVGSNLNESEYNLNFKH